MLGLLRESWTGQSRYIEPFAGSACLFFDLEPTDAIIGDLNGELIESYRILRDCPEDLIKRIREWRPTRETYYKVRNLALEKLSAIELAARFFFLNRYCFNGLYRTNLSGKFNVPFGAPNKDHQIDEGQLLDASAVLRRARLMNADFMVTLDQARAGDFVYLDPPYVLREKRVFSEYLPNSFQRSDLDRLKDGLISLDTRGVTFVVTYADCDEARDLMRGWKPKKWQARRNIAGFTSSRKFSPELIATNRTFES
jgi:DNA adenine methylase